MQNCPYLELVYKENGVYIYKILEQNSSDYIHPEAANGIVKFDT
jgi:hypothetical protein